MHHCKPPAMMQCILRSLHGICKRRRKLVPCSGPPPTPAHRPAVHGAIGRIRKNHIESPGCKKCGRIAIISLPHGDFLCQSIHHDIAHGKFRLSWIQLYRCNFCRSVCDKQGDDPRSRAKVKNPFIPMQLRKMREQYGIHRKAKTIRPLDDLASAA